MKHSVIFLLIFLFGGYSSVSADDSYRTLKDIQQNIQSLYAEKDTIQERWEKFFEENGKIQEFIKSDLTEQDTAIIGEMIAYYGKQKLDFEMKLSQVLKKGEDTQILKEEIIKLKLDLYKKFVPYIQVSKLDEYLNFIKGNIVLVKTDKDLKEEIFREQQIYDKKVDSLREKIEANKKNFDEQIRSAVGQRIQEKIFLMTSNPDFIALSTKSKLLVFSKILEKIKERKQPLTLIKNKTTILEKKIEIFTLFEERINDQIDVLEK